MATIVRPLSDPHSYEVLGPTGTLRRTRHHIRPIPPDNTTTITATDNTPQAPAITDYVYIPNVQEPSPTAPIQIPDTNIMTTPRRGTRIRNAPIRYSP